MSLHVATSDCGSYTSSLESCYSSDSPRARIGRPKTGAYAAHLQFIASHNNQPLQQQDSRSLLQSSSLLSTTEFFSSLLTHSVSQSVCLSVVCCFATRLPSRVGSSLHLSSPAPSVDYSSFSPSPFHFPRGDTFVKLLGRKEGVYKLGASNRGGFFSKV